MPSQDNFSDSEDFEAAFLEKDEPDTETYEFGNIKVNRGPNVINEGEPKKNDHVTPQNASFSDESEFDCLLLDKSTTSKADGDTERSAATVIMKAEAGPSDHVAPGLDQEEFDEFDFGLESRAEVRKRSTSEAYKRQINAAKKHFNEWTLRMAKYFDDPRADPNIVHKYSSLKNKDFDSIFDQRTQTADHDLMFSYYEYWILQAKNMRKKVSYKAVYYY